MILRALGLGDLLVAVPALAAIARSFPDHERVLACPSPLAPLALLTQAVDRVVATRGLESAVNIDRPDVAINLHGKGPGSHRLLLAAGCNRLVAFHNDEVAITEGFPRWIAGEHEVVRWCRMLNSFGIDARRDELGLPHPGPPPPELIGATIIHPGAKAAARRWPPSKWARVAARRVRAGEKVVISGSPAERDLALRIARAADLDDEAVIAGRTEIMDLAQVVATARLVLSSDTGIAHLATAFGTPSIALFGPVAPSQWGPPPERPHHIALWRGPLGDSLAETPHPGLTSIGVDEVEEAIRGLEADLERT